MNIVNTKVGLSAICLLIAATAGDGFDNLLDERPQIRKEALTALRAERSEQEARLEDCLRAAFKARDRAYGGTTHTAIQAVAILRAESAVPQLLRSIEFSLDPTTHPRAGFQRPEENYPAAIALRDLGGREVIKQVIKSAARTESDTALALHAWVLAELIGSGAARVSLFPRGPKIEARPPAIDKLLALLKAPIVLPEPPAEPKP